MSVLGEGDRGDEPRLTPIMARIRVLLAVDAATWLWPRRSRRAPSATRCGCCARAGMVSTRKAGRVVFYRLAAGSPESLREHCLQRFVELTRATTGQED